MKLGKCIDLTALTPNIVEGGGASAAWTAASATSGTFTVEFPPGRSCPGGDPGAELDPYASCSFHFSGCGQIHLTAAGTSGALDGRPVASSQLVLADGSTLSTQPSLNMVGGTGGTACDSVDLSGDDDVTFLVSCGMQLTLYFDGLFSANAPATSVTFNVEVIS